jgi:hypothetical protein
MHQRTDLSAGNLNGSDRLSVELIRSPDSPPIVATIWPSTATITTPGQYTGSSAALLVPFPRSEDRRTLGTFHHKEVIGGEY